MSGQKGPGHAGAGGRKSRVNSDQVQEDASLKPLSEKPTLSKENLVAVRLRDLETSTLFAEIAPPFFKNISLVKFSPSGRYLIIGNENCQYFYIYEILPQSNQRFRTSACGSIACNQERVRLTYSLFRGYTSAQVTDIQFVSGAHSGIPNGVGRYTDHEQILIINSSNGTSHVYSLKKPKKTNDTPIFKRNARLQDMGDNVHFKIINLQPKTRFKYKQMIQQGELKVVSLAV